MNSKSIVGILFLCGGIYYAPLHGIVQGSYTTVSVQPFATFPASDTDNTLAGFGWFRNGFALQDTTTTCTFDSIYPVSGSVQLNGGTLYLNQDLVFNNMTTLLSLGTIIGNNHVVDFCASVTWFSSTDNTFQDALIRLNTDVALSSNHIFRGYCVLDGSNHALILGDGASITVDSGATLLIRDVIIQNVAQMNINLVDDSSTLIMDTVNWIQTGDFTFSTGSMQFLNKVHMRGAYNFFYESLQTSTILSMSEWHMSDNMQLNIGMYEPNASVQPLAFVDNTSILRMENAFFNVNPNGIQLTKGVVAVERNFQVDIQGTSSATALVLGDGTPEGDMIFDLYPGSSTVYTGGDLVYNITNVNGIRSNTDAIKMIRSDASVFWLAQDLQLTNISVQVGDASTLYVSPGKSLNYSNSTVQIPQGSFVLNGIRYNDYTTLLSGNQSIFLINGALPLYTLVSGTGNIIEGNGSVAGQVIFQDSNAQLLWGVEGQLLNTMSLNGGQLTLLGDFECANGVQFAGPGIVHLGNVSFNLGQQDLLWPDAIYWDGSNGVLNINSNITLSNLWTFSGNCVLDGHGAILDIADGAIEIEAGSTLHLKNIIVRNIGDNNFYCVDDAGTLILDSVTWHQHANLIFDLGSIEWKNKVIMQGEEKQFTYQSDQISTILALSSLTLDESFTFSYDSSFSSLLQFADDTSTLALNLGSTLHATLQGLNLIKGNIQVRDNANIGGEKWTSADLSTTIDNGITFGDCSNSANDCVVSIGAGVNLNIPSGSLNYKNVSGNSLIIKNNLSALNILENATLNAYQSISMGNAITTMGNFASLGRAPGADFNGSISTLGVAYFPMLNPC